MAASLVLAWLHFPAAWLTGGLVGAAVAVLCRQHFALPAAAVNASYVLLGALFGSAIKPAIVDQMLVWAGTLILSCLSLAAIMVASTWYLIRREGWDRKTAFFATAPGALPAVIALAAEYPVNQGRIVLSQTVRLVSFMAIVPLLFSAPGAGVLQAAQDAVLDPRGLTVVALAAITGALAGRLARLPAGLMIGALIGAGALYAFDGVRGEIPAILQNFAMMVIGMLVGMQLSRLSLADLSSSLRAVFAVLVLGTAISALFAWLAAQWSGVGFLQVLLAFLPGAMEGMTVLGFILGLDPAFISLHHVVRFLFVVLSLPLISRGWAR